MLARWAKPCMSFQQALLLLCACTSDFVVYSILVRSEIVEMLLLHAGHL